MSAICSIPGCERKRAARGYCQTHYVRDLKGHDLHAPIQAKGPGYGPGNKICKVDGCDRRVASRGYCGMHYQRAKHGKEFDVVPRKRAPKGSASKCYVCGAQPVVGWGMCSVHYQRWRRHGSSEVMKRRSNGAGSIDSAGYKSVTHEGRRIKEHRLVMERHLGRELTSEETVHHLPRGKSDNTLDNLELWSSRHPRGQRVTDLVTFAREILDLYG